MAYQRKLPKIDVQSPTWVAIKEQLNEWLRVELGMLVSKDTDFVGTSVSRGAYAAYKRILDLEEAIIKANQQAFD